MLFFFKPFCYGWGVAVVRLLRSFRVVYNLPVLSLLFYFATTAFVARFSMTCFDDLCFFIGIAALICVIPSCSYVGSQAVCFVAADMSGLLPHFFLSASVLLTFICMLPAVRLHDGLLSYQ